MTDRVLLFLFTAALLVSLSGCKKAASSISPSPSPTPTATPFARTQASPQIVATVKAVGGPEPDLETAIPLKTFQVKPPVSFGSDQFREQGVFEFRVFGNAGQVLHIKLDQGWYEQLVKPLEGVSHTIVPGGDELGNWLYVLPETGVYRVLVQRVDVKHLPTADPAIQFALLNLGDPTVDPGVRPEQITVDFSEFAPHAKWMLVPYSHFGGEVDDFWPSHLALKDGQFEFRIMPIEGYRRIVSAEDIDNLQSALRADGGGGDPRKFPYASYGDAALMIATRPKLIQGEGWRGLRWIGEYGQDSGCGFSDFTYIFEAITHDGKFFMRMQTSVSNLQAGKNLDRRCGEESKARTFDEFFEKQMPVLFDKELSSADPASFQPNLDRLDAAVRAFKVKQ